MPERRRKYTTEFKIEAAKMVVESGRPITEVAHEIHANPGTLGNWVKQHRVKHADEEPPLAITERAHLKEPEKGKPRIKDEKRVPGTSGGLLRPGVSVRATYQLIDAEKANFPIVTMCEWAGVSTSGYYEWRNRPASTTAIRHEHLTTLITAIFELSDETYDYPRVHAQLVRQGEQISDEPVRELMREPDLISCQPRPYRPTTTTPGDPSPIPDLVNRDVTADAPAQNMVSDITIHSHHRRLAVSRHRHRLLHPRLHRIRHGR